MKHYKLQLFMVLCLFGGLSNLKAQEKTSEKKSQKFKLSVELLATQSNRKANTSSLYDVRYVPKSGFGVQATGEYVFYKKLFATLGLGYVQKNYQFERTGDYNYSGMYTHYKNNFINIPLMVGGYIFHNPFQQDKGFWAKLAGGVYTEYLASLQKKGNYPTFFTIQYNNGYEYSKVTEHYDFKTNQNHYRRWGMGIQAQAQVGYTFKKLDVFAGATVQQGLTQMVNYRTSDAPKQVLLAYLFSAGIGYKF